jgi:hypothetical protein
MAFGLPRLQSHDRQRYLVVLDGSTGSGAAAEPRADYVDGRKPLPIDLQGEQSTQRQLDALYSKISRRLIPIFMVMTGAVVLVSNA